MSLRDIQNIRIEYQTLSDNVVESFYIPCLREASEYKRAVGFFSSSILLQITKGLSSMVERNAKIKLLVSPRLEKKDYEAIEKGYEIKKYVEDKMASEFDEEIDCFQKNERFGLLAYLVANGALDIKVAVVDNEDNDKAIYHEKLGLMLDNSGNIIAFSGSANETYQGYNLNYENIDVFCSWKSDDADERCRTKNYRFDEIWNGNSNDLIVLPFPQVIKDKLFQYYDHKNEDKDFFVSLDSNYIKFVLQKQLKDLKPNINDINFHEYQKEAIEAWKNNNYKGVFDMATGTGKTYTACGAIANLCEEKNRLTVYICCPYIHLVEQWCEEVKKFNIDPIKCYGGIDYQDKLKRKVMKFKHKRTDFFCVVVCNSTFTNNFFQEMIQVNEENTLLVVDEAHNFGADNISKYMNYNIPYRLALSATLERYGDKRGTQKLMDYFESVVYSYSLDRAIQEDKLSKYYYYPVVVYLDDEEREKYRSLTDEAKRFFMKSDEELPEALKKILIKRARIIAGAKGKIGELCNKIEKYKNKSNLLIYCGAVKYGDYGYDNDTEDKKQIEIVNSILNKKMGIIAANFTANEDSFERKRIIEAYVEERIQAIIAIKCLDEGVNIPGIRTAFILASSTNPKEYIQRRGRVLRKAPGKKYAEIYDFVVLPRPLEEVSLVSVSERKSDESLVKRELLRVIDFARLSENPSFSNSIIDEIKFAYSMDIIKEDDEDEYYY